MGGDGDDRCFYVVGDGLVVGLWGSGGCGIGSEEEWVKMREYSIKEA